MRPNGRPWVLHEGTSVAQSVKHEGYAALHCVDPCGVLYGSSAHVRQAECMASSIGTMDAATVLYTCAAERRQV